eukprot:1052092-Pleurochrysis_carterae.AAC.1
MRPKSVAESWQHNKLPASRGGSKDGASPSLNLPTCHANEFYTVANLTHTHADQSRGKVFHSRPTASAGVRPFLLARPCLHPTSRLDSYGS